MRTMVLALLWIIRMICGTVNLRLPPLRKSKILARTQNPVAPILRMARWANGLYVQTMGPQARIYIAKMESFWHSKNSRIPPWELIRSSRDGCISLKVRHEHKSQPGDHRKLAGFGSVR